jgi:hypothetical protein
MTMSNYGTWSLPQLKDEYLFNFKIKIKMLKHSSF